jgi:hypothetical protein
MSCRSLWAVSFKHKEKPSRPAWEASHACFQHTHARSQDALRHGHHAPARRVGRQCSQYLQVCEQASTVRLQYGYSVTPALWTTRLAALQCQMTQQHDTTLLTECSVAGDKTRHAYTVEDIICYSYPLVSYCIGFSLPQGYLSELGSHYNYPALSYKRLGQTSVLYRCS